MPSVFLLNAIVLFSGVVAFLIAGFAGLFARSLQPWRFRLMLPPLGFVICGGVSISAEQHLLRWLQHGHLTHSFGAGLIQSIVLVLAGLCGLLAGLGLGTSLDANYPSSGGTGVAAPWPGRRTPPAGKAKVVPISRGRQPGVVPHIKASSDHE